MSNAQARLVFLSQWAAKPVSMVRPVGRHADRRVVEAGGRQRIERERRPVADQDHRQRDPLARAAGTRQQEQERVAQADLRQRVLEREVGLRSRLRRRKTPSSDQDERPPERVRSMRPTPGPGAARLAIENGRPRRPGTRTTAGSGPRVRSRPTRRVSEVVREPSRHAARLESSCD